MKKRRKIKRYGNIYVSQVKKAKRLKVILAVLCLALLVLAGWLIYPPVRDFLLAEENTEKNESESTPAEKSSTPAPTVPPVSEGTNDVPPVVPPAEKPSLKDGARGAYLPASVAVSEDELEAKLKNMSLGGVNTVLMEAKDANGVVHFKTENSVAVSAKTVADDAYNAEKTAELIHENGMIAAARIHAFKDPASSRSVKEMAVTYGDSGTRWLDNSADLGGKSWLNPCSPKAQEYIMSLAVELTKAGFDEIVLDSVQFPSGVGLEKASYGLTGSFSRRGILQDFIADITEAVEGAGGRVIIGIPADSIELDDPSKALTRANTGIYGGSPELIAPKNGLLIFSDSSILADALAKAKANAPDSVWSVFLPNTAPDGSAIAVGKDDAEGADGYFIYNPQGTYIFN